MLTLLVLWNTQKRFLYNTNCETNFLVWLRCGFKQLLSRVFALSFFHLLAPSLPHSVSFGVCHEMHFHFDPVNHSLTSHTQFDCVARQRLAISKKKIPPKTTTKQKHKREEKKKANPKRNENMFHFVASMLLYLFRRMLLYVGLVCVWLCILQVSVCFSIFWQAVDIIQKVDFALALCVTKRKGKICSARSTQKRDTRETKQWLRWWRATKSHYLCYWVRLWLAFCDGLSLSLFRSLPFKPLANAFVDAFLFLTL